MGIFRHTSATATTDTIPASTTLSARTRLSRRTTIATASALTCAGVFYVAVNANSSSSSAPSSLKPAIHSSTVELNVDQQHTTPPTTTGATVVPTVPTNTTTTVNASRTGDSSTPTSLTVNGQPIDVPPNGSVNKTVLTNTNTGQTSLEVNASSQGSSSNTNFTSLNVNVSSNSTTSSDPSP